ncbi:hypothetical protein [Mesorhizobium sp.]|uniref:hypothetical protein n=1 Tax=Mesorhizobium sp. TaxID=1871066 RepID=UPI0025BD1BD0|nr:hypothetical protein [Mesorhizobium sp.]
MSDPLRVLVVEDEWLIAEDIAACLRALGHQVIGPAPAKIMSTWRCWMFNCMAKRAWRSQRNYKPATFLLRA